MRSIFLYTFQIFSTQDFYLFPVFLQAPVSEAQSLRFFRNVPLNALLDRSLWLRISEDYFSIPVPSLSLVSPLLSLRSWCVLSFSSDCEGDTFCTPAPPQAGEGLPCTCSALVQTIFLLFLQPSAS